MAKNPMEGRIAEIQFDSGRHFRIDFLPENKLRWTSIRQQDYGVTDVESTHVEILGDGLYAIDWIEKDGLCVSYSVDVNAQFVRSYMSWSDNGGPYGGRDFLTHEGPFFFIQENGERDLRPFTSLEIARAFFTALAGPDLGQNAVQPASLAGNMLAEDFVFQSGGKKLGKAAFIAALEAGGKNCGCGEILSTGADKNTVFIETANSSGNGNTVHLFTVSGQLVSSYRQIG